MNTPPPRSGILAGGNWIVDHVKCIDAWPDQDALASIQTESWCNGGSPYNILKDLVRLGATFPLEAVGLVGEDADGTRIISDCSRHNIDVAQLHLTARAPTSYSDVMTDVGTGRRTFFHQRGANALLGPEHFDFTQTRARLFHLGYLVLLDRIDAPDPANNNRPFAFEVFRRARAAGLRTSLDCVSERGDRFRTVVAPVLPEIDVLFINDLESEHLTGIALRKDARLLPDAVRLAAAALLAMGVREWVIIHFPEGAFAAGARQQVVWQPSLRVPPADIRGSSGAGDAFAAGVLHRLHDNASISDALHLGVCAAASCLYNATSSEGVLTAAQCLALAERLGFRTA